MNWFSNLFKKNTVSKSLADKSESEWQTYINYAAGEQKFFNEDWKNALYYFDRSIENGHYKDDIFEFRGTCLQALGYDFDAIKDFDKAIYFFPTNCNLYYFRSISKQTILDYEGAISDIKKAIELSKLDNNLNKIYNENAINNGFKNGVVGMYEIALYGAKSKLKNDIREIKKDFCDEQLKLIKRR